MTWDDMKFWQSGEWQVIQENLDDLDKKKKRYNPARHLMFAALDATPLKDTRVMIMGQDPYPSHELCTGLAFSIPKGVEKFPPTLENIFKEYQSDLGLPPPSHGNLEYWASQGVLLWNSVPSCDDGKPGSHSHWPEWDYLTKEIVELLSEKGIVFVLLGAWARKYKQFIEEDGSYVIETSHPSPLGVRAKNNPFFGSRIFSRTNDYLNQLKLGPIDWRL